MPFVQRVVSPVYLSRARLHDQRGKPTVSDQELDAISNHTLCFALKQLASVLNIANKVFNQLNGELDLVKDKSTTLKGRIAKLQEAVDKYDPKNIIVPVGDMTWFSELKSHYRRSQECSGSLFTASSRPAAVQDLYRLAAQETVEQNKSSSSPSPSLTVTPVLGRTRRRQARLPQVDIETRKPAILAGVRKWTSIEALGELTVDPDATLRVNPTPDAVDHTLPSPEEQLHAIANKFPSEMVCVDTSGKSFDRMSFMRRSLVLRQPPSRKRRTRRQRRNTIATTDPKEIHQAASESTETVVGKSWAELVEKKSQLEALKEWGLGRLRSLRPLNKPIKTGIDSRTAVTMRLAAGRKLATEPHSSSGNWSASSESGHSTTTTHHPRSSISSGSTCLKQRRPITASTSSSVTSESSTITPENDFETGSMYSCDTEGYYTSFHLDSGLKPLREEEPSAALSSTSILTASTLSQGLNGESEYELFGRGSTSTTASSAGTVCTALPAPPPRRDSHLSGNRTFPERSRPLRPQTHSLRPADLSRSDHVDHLTRENLTLHNEDRVTASEDHIRERPEKCGDSPDSGHNTCSSPVDSVASPSLDVVSECSDLEGVDRVERIRVKTTINSSRIPSMCVITPPQSDDETSFKLESIDSGEYVTIAQIQQTITEVRPSELVSLNTLPNENSLERRRQGARVTLDSDGKVIYASDSLKRKKTVHTIGTFEPGPCVVNNSSPIMPRVANIRPVQIRSPIAIQKNTDCIKTVNSDNHKTLLKKETNIQNDFGRNSAPQSPIKISKEKQYFPKSAYERENPCKSVRPMSPLAKQPNPSIKSPVLATKTVVKAGSPTRSLSPVVSRGAYVRIQQPSDDLSFGSNPSCGFVQPVPHPAVKRSDSYRLANQDTVFNPNSLGRRQYGPGVIASPTLLTALHEAQTIPAAPKEDEIMPSKILQTSVDGPCPRPGVLQTHFDDFKSPNDSIQSNLDSPRSPSKVLSANFDNLRLSPSVPQVNMNSPRSSNRVLQTHFDGLRSSSNVVHSNMGSPKLPISPTTLDFTKKLSQKEYNKQTNDSGISDKMLSSQKTLNISSPARTSATNLPSPLTSTPTKSGMPVLDFSSVSSPIEKSPPKNARSGMDLFAIIHDSKKKIQSIQQNANQINWPKTLPAKIKSGSYKSPSPQNDNILRQPSKPVENKEVVHNGILKHMPKPMFPLTDLNTKKYTRHNTSYNSLPRMKIQNYEESPKNLVQRKVYGRQSQGGSSRGGPTSTQDFKRLLLQTGTGSSGYVKESAVDRLKNKNISSQPIKHNVLSSTIPEDCEVEEDMRKSPVMMSASLVNKQSKAFQRSSPTLETSL